MHHTIIFWKCCLISLFTSFQVITGRKKSLPISTKHFSTGIVQILQSVWCIVFNVGQIVSWHSSQNTWAAQHVIDSLHASSSLKSSGSETTHSSVLMVITHFNLLNMSANFSQKVSVTDVSQKSTFTNRFTFHYTDSQAAAQFAFSYYTLSMCFTDNGKYVLLSM